MLDSYTLIFFTDYNTDFDFKDTIGFIKLGLIVFAVLVNIIVIVKIWFISLKMKLRKQKVRKILK